MFIKKITRHKAPNIIRVLLTAVLLVFYASGAEARVRHIFLFIGDGMGTAQRNAAELYLAGMRRSLGDTSPRESQLLMNALPVNGEAATSSLSGITDSAAAGTALATGHKTTNGRISMDSKGRENFDSIAAIAKRRGMKAGIVTSAFLQDATPAVFYAHAPGRTLHYSIGLQLADSGFEYFAGGGFRNPRGSSKKERDLRDIASSKGYFIAAAHDELSRIPSGSKAIAIHPGVSSGYMPWAIDAEKSGLSLADFVKKGIELLRGDAGFFMMVEGGKIDLACHANDAAASIHEVIALDEALSAALDFYRANPDDTLIVVTSDHETGGMAVSVSADESVRFYEAMAGQKGSYASFERMISPKGSGDISAYLYKARNFFGAEIPLTDSVEKAFRMSMTQKKNRPTGSADYKKQWGPYDPFTISCMREMNLSAGVRWSSFYHTGKPVPVSAIGEGSEAFAGEYANTEIFVRLMKAVTED
jgi:alkaline phosphatase